MKAGIAVEKFKLKTFEKILKEAGYSWIEEPGVTNDSLILMVEYVAKDLDNLTRVVKKANRLSRKNN